jgi:hypothetical protein
MLESIAGNMPSKHLAACYNSWASKSGYPPRSVNAIKSMMSRSKISRRAEGEWITCSYIADVLGLKIDTPQRWAEKGFIECYRNRGRSTHRYFRRSDLVEMARKHPSLLGGIDRNNLLALLEDEDLVGFIAASHPRRKGSGMPVEAIESGRIFPSVKAAARALYVTPQGIHSAMRIGGTCAGFHWRRIQQPNESVCNSQESRLSPQRKD